MRFLGPTTCYTSPSGVKSVLIGGTYANLTNNNINIFVEVSSGSTSTNIANDIPVPTGSSFVISDAGKTIMLSGDELRVYCDTENGLDVTLGILQGVGYDVINHGYIGRAPSDSSVTITRQSNTASGVTTTFTFSAGYDVGYLDVYINGARLINVTDYAATDGSTITLSATPKLRCC